MTCPLDSLAAEPSRSGEEKFVHMKTQFTDFPEARLPVLFKKVIFIYKYIDCLNRLQEHNYPAGKNSIQHFAILNAQKLNICVLNLF